MIKSIALFLITIVISAILINEFIIGGSFDGTKSYLISVGVGVFALIGVFVSIAMFKSSLNSKKLRSNYRTKDLNVMSFSKKPHSSKSVIKENL